MLKIQHTLGDDASPNGVHYTPGVVCPACKSPNTGAGSVERGNTIKPAAGDLTICVYCETISKYVKSPTGWRLRKLTPRQLQRMDPENKDEFEKLKPILAKVWGPLGSRKPSTSH